VVAEGHIPEEQKTPADPLKGPVTLKLRPHDLDRRSPDLILRGRVLDEKGKPVANATVQPWGIQLEHGGRFGALHDLVDPLAVTNEKGEFRLGTTKKGAPLYLEVNAPFLARLNAGWFAPGPEVHEVTLAVGVFVRGKIVKDGKGVPGITLQLSSTRPRGPQFISGPGPFRPWDDMQMKIDTDREGSFLFSNVPPDRKYRLWGIMDSCRKYGVVPERTVVAGASGTSLDIGELAMRSGLRLSGRLLVQDGKPPPAGARVVLGLRYEETAFGDSQLAITEADGKFEFAGLPPAVYRVTVRAPGYHVSSKNRSYAVVTAAPQENGLIGRVDHDIDELRLLLEPGPEPAQSTTPAPDYRKLPREERRKRLEEQRQQFDELRRRREAPLQGLTAE
jgi:Carboxypeptidase regulatory-like domain